ncbi:FlgB family protein [Pseudosulfitobacter sp. SM2401]|uniref:FlgB family protein n=1 Tax=Pseudosulfitobacter sp. SM2401 TaxID=3350098 RepID=UPI002A2A1C42|nr:FlgB family protein [Ascidiaceihabitans sp.]
MFENLDVFKISHAMATHAGQRQALIAQNVANADTPGYIARDIPAFKAAYENDGSSLQRATRSKHLNGVSANGNSTPIDQRAMASPDGNTVSIEQEMLKATDTVRQHDRALAIYKSSLGILRSALGRR